jgi:hypothetical protein
MQIDLFGKFVPEDKNLADSETMPHCKLELEAENLNQALAGISFALGEAVAKSLMTTPTVFLLRQQNNPENITVLRPDLGIMTFAEYDTLICVPEVTGEIPVPAILIGVLVAAGVEATIAATALALIGNILIATAISAVMSALSPTPEFRTDPSEAKTKRSSLYNGTPILTEEGGSVPLMYGNPFCSGVLISAGLSSEEVNIEDDLGIFGTLGFS